MKNSVPKALNSRKSPAVILGLGVNGLGHIRSLALKGMKVIGIYTNCEEEEGRFSRLCKTVRFPDIKENKRKFKKKLIELGESLAQKSVLFATSDLYAQFMSEFREELQSYFLFTLPAKKMLKEIINKNTMKELAARAGLTVPKTFSLSSLSSGSVAQIAEKITYPCLIKPLDSFSTVFPGKNRAVQDKEELVEFYHRYPDFLGKTIIQELIIGGDQNIFQCTAYFNKDSLPLGVFTMQKIRQYPPNFGITSFGVSKSVPELVKQTFAFLKSINYKGFASLEFKWDAKRGKYFFIEVNPRLPWYNSLFTVSGVNFPYLAYMDHIYPSSLNGKMLKQIDGVHWLNLRVDIGSFWRRRKSGDWISFWKWFRSILHARSFGYWHPRDPLPFLHSTFGFLTLLKHKTIGKPTGNYERRI